MEAGSAARPHFKLSSTFATAQGWGQSDAPR